MTLRFQSQTRPAHSTLVALLLKPQMEKDTSIYPKESRNDQYTRTFNPFFLGL